MIKQYSNVFLDSQQWTILERKTMIDQQITERWDIFSTVSYSAESSRAQSRTALSQSEHSLGQRWVKQSTVSDSAESSRAQSWTALSPAEHSLRQRWVKQSTVSNSAESSRAQSQTALNQAEQGVSWRNLLKIQDYIYWFVNWTLFHTVKCIILLPVQKHKSDWQVAHLIWLNYEEISQPLPLPAEPACLGLWNLSSLENPEFPMISQVYCTVYMLSLNLLT